MLNWYRIRLSRDDMASGELTVLRGAFRDVYIAKNGPRGMALFGAWSRDGDYYSVYVSPASTRYVRPLLEAYSASAEDPRNPRALDWLSGDEACLSVLIC